MPSAKVRAEYESPRIRPRRPTGGNDLSNSGDRLCRGRAAPMAPAPPPAPITTTLNTIAATVSRGNTSTDLLVRQPTKPPSCDQASLVRPEMSATSSAKQRARQPTTMSNLVGQIPTYHPKPKPAATAKTIRARYTPKIPKIYSTYDVEDSISFIFGERAQPLRIFSEPKLLVVLPPEEAVDPRDFQKRGTLLEKEEQRHLEYLQRTAPDQWERARRQAEALLPFSYNAMTEEQDCGQAVFQLDHLPVEEDEVRRRADSQQQMRRRRSSGDPLLAISSPDRTPSPTGGRSSTTTSTSTAGGIQMKYVYSPIRTSCLVSGSALEAISRSSVAMYQDAKKTAHQMVAQRLAEKEEHDRLEFEHLLNPVDREEQQLKLARKEVRRRQRARARRIEFAASNERSGSSSNVEGGAPTTRRRPSLASPLSVSLMKEESAEGLSSSEDESAPPISSTFEDAVDANRLISRTPWVIDVSSRGVSKRRERRKLETVLDKAREVVKGSSWRDTCVPLTHLLDSVESQLASLAASGRARRSPKKANSSAPSSPAPSNKRSTGRRFSRSPASPGSPASPPSSPPSGGSKAGEESISPPQLNCTLGVAESMLQAVARTPKISYFDPRRSLPFTTLAFEGCTITGPLLQRFFDALLPLTTIIERLQKLQTSSSEPQSVTLCKSNRHHGVSFGDAANNLSGTRSSLLNQIPILQSNVILLCLTFNNCTLDEGVLSLIGTVFKSYRISLVELHLHRCSLPGGGAPQRTTEVLYTHRATLESFKWRSTFLSSSVFTALCSFVTESKRLRVLDIGNSGVTSKEEVFSLCDALRDTHCPLEVLNVDSMPLPQGVGGRFVAAIEELVNKWRKQHQQKKQHRRTNISSSSTGSMLGGATSCSGGLSGVVLFQEGEGEGEGESDDEQKGRLRCVSTRYCDGTTPHFQVVIQQCIK